METLQEKPLVQEVEQENLDLTRETAFRSSVWIWQVLINIRRCLLNPLKLRHIRTKEQLNTSCITEKAMQHRQQSFSKEVRKFRGNLTYGGFAYKLLFINRNSPNFKHLLPNGSLYKCYKFYRNRARVRPCGATQILQISRFFSDFGPEIPKYGISTWNLALRMGPSVPALCQI